MPQFRYVVQDANGRLIRGVIEAENRANLLTQFHERRYRVVSIDLATTFEVAFEKILDQFTGVSRQTIVLFTRQLAALVRAGLPLAQSLESLVWQERNQKFRAVIEVIKSDIEKGGSFSEALARYPKLFSPLYVGMIEAGEAAGILGDVLERLARVSLQELEVRTKLQAAFTYPIILLSVALLVVLFLLVGAVPKFLDIFKSSNAELPLATVILLSVSSALRRFWLVLLLAMAGIVVVAVRYYGTPQGRLFCDRAVLQVPVFGEIYLKMVTARLTRSLSALTKSGIPLLRALEISKAVVTNLVLLNALETIRAGVTQGKSLTELFRSSGIFPPMVVQMVSVGETTGQLDAMLSEVANFYELEMEYFLRNLTSSLEPILLLLMGLMVGFIALAVLMPVFQLVKVFK